MEKSNIGATTGPAAGISEGERRAQRTLAAAQRLLNPESGPEMSSVEVELTRYVKQAYRRRSYG
ncbi:hypothetical protein [Achromobacter sp. RTa]|uniref:hypothetical protein n=1 Tax=Achromobacter sp. RTa TaxID=1532557 RepID=UPI000A797445|nr:hypothetical protein [Achromobacter sp. RTa]